MPTKKICVISLDHWNYDKHIISNLQYKGIISQHINFGDYKHPNIQSRLKNFLWKLFLRKNLKKIKRQEYIIEKLKQLGKQDQILVVNPDLIDKYFHLEIKKHTNRYIAYLYDSVSRHPVEHLLDGVFDKIYSFDKDDVEKYNFEKTSNYIYINKQEFNHLETPEYQLLYIATLDNRINLLNIIVEKLNQLKISFRFIIVDRKSKNIPFIEIRKKRINQEDLSTYYNQTNIILDLVRDNQSGLSFRIFEAMAYQKKIITSNNSISEYDFYNSNNIMIINEDKLDINPLFFSTPYQPLPDNIYNKYTLDSWVKTIFEL